MVTVELRKPDPRGRQRLLHPRTGAERRRLITLAHESRCKLGLSYRGTRDRLAEHGARVALGTVFNWLHGYTCNWCQQRADRASSAAARRTPASPRPASPGEPEQARAAVYRWS